MTDVKRASVSPLAMATLIAIVTIVAFLPALSNEFVTWDDDKNFLNNPDYRGLGVAQLRWMWTTFHLGHYVPLSWMTLGFDYVVWEMNPAGYHLTSIVLHAANGVLVFFVGQRLLRAAGVDSVWGAALAALLFAVHPLRVESVAWATERRDVLSGLFFFGALVTYLRFVAEMRARWYTATLALFAAALLAKATSLTLPALIVVLNVWPLRRLGGAAGWQGAAKRVALEVLPLGVLAIVAVSMTFTALQDLPQLPVAGKIAVSAYSAAFYLLKTIIPTGLSPLYAMPESVDPGAFTFIASYAAVAAITATALALRKRFPALLLAWVAFLVVELPMLGIHQNGPQIAADRYTYHAAPVLTILVAGCLWAMLRARVAATVGSALVLVLIPLSWRQERFWHDSRALWSRALAVDSVSPVAHNNWASLLLERDSVTAAEGHFAQALALAPNYPQALNGLGIALTRQGRYAEATVQFAAALRADTLYDEPLSNWGVALARQGDLAGAILRYQESIGLNLNNPEARVNLGNAYVRLGRLDDAIVEYREALRIRPGYADAHFNWGVALAQQEKFSDAVVQFEQALRIRPEDIATRAYLERAARLAQPKR